MEDKKEKEYMDEFIQELMEEPVVLYDEDDNEHQFETVAVINLDEYEDLFILVSPLEENEDIGFDEVLILTFDEEDNLISVHDEEIINKVMDEYERLLEEEEE